MGSRNPCSSGAHYALMDTREAALAELQHVFALIAQEHQDREQALPKDTTEIVHAERDGGRVSARGAGAWFRAAPPDRQSRTLDAQRWTVSCNFTAWWTGNRPAAVFQDSSTTQCVSGGIRSGCANKPECASSAIGNPLDPDCYAFSTHRRNDLCEGLAAGVRYPSVMRGRVFSRSAMVFRRA